MCCVFARARHRDSDAERRLMDLRQSEASVAEQADRLSRLLAETEKREAMSLEQVGAGAGLGLSWDCSGRPDAMT